MNTEMRAFLREGLGMYSEAKHTLALFEREMEKLLDAALSKRGSWSPLKRRKLSPSKAGGGELGWWIAASVLGLSPGRRGNRN
jgi:hypothetical protein